MFSSVARKVLVSTATTTTRSKAAIPVLARQFSSTSTTAMPTTIQRVETTDPRMAKMVIHNDIAYLSGLIDATGENVTEQTKNVLAQVDDLLEKAGTSKSNILTASIWLKDIGKDFEAMNKEWVAWLDPENKPARATVESPMASPKILVEIQVTAVI